MDTELKPKSLTSELLVPGVKLNAKYPPATKPERGNVMLRFVLVEFPPADAETVGKVEIFTVAPLLAVIVGVWW
jgi:hypothetical protein